MNNYLRSGESQNPSPRPLANGPNQKETYSRIIILKLYKNITKIKWNDKVTTSVS